MYLMYDVVNLIMVNVCYVFVLYSMFNGLVLVYLHVMFDAWCLASALNM